MKRLGASAGQRQLPAVEQVGAHEGQQQQGHQAQARARRPARRWCRRAGSRWPVRNAGCRAGANAGGAPAGSAARPAARAPPAWPAMPTSIAEPSVAEPAFHHSSAPRPDEAGERDQPGARFGGIEVAAQHAQRRHAAQRQHRRRAEGQQHDQPTPSPAAPAASRRPESRSSVSACSQPPIAHCRPKAISTPTRAGDQAQQQQFADMDADQGALAGAEAAHHRGAGEMALAVAARRHRHGDRGQHHRDQRSQAEEAAGAIERRADFRARVLRWFPGAGRAPARARDRR